MRRLHALAIATGVLVSLFHAHADSDTITAKLDCSDSGTGWYEDDYGWQSLNYNIEAHFTLQGVFALQDGDLSLYQLTNKVGSVHFWGQAEDVFFGATTVEGFDFHQNLSLATVSGVLHYLAKSNRVTYAGFSLERSTAQSFQPYHLRFYNDGTSAFARVFIDPSSRWYFDDFCDGGGNSTVRPFMLTFDDGPKPCTANLLSGLAQIHAQGNPVVAGFFMVGSNDPAYHAVEPWHDKGSVVLHPAIARQVAQAGHIVGNHTQHHADYRKYLGRPDPVGDFATNEILSCQQTLTATLGQAPPRKLFRAPYLISEAGLSSAVDRSGFKEISGKTVGDYAYGLFPSFSHVAFTKGHAATVLKNWSGPEPCVLIFHDIFPEICDHIGEIVEHLRNLGYTLVSFNPDVSGSDQGGVAQNVVCKPETFGTTNLFIIASIPSGEHDVSLENSEDLSVSGSWGASGLEPMLVDDLYVFPVSQSKLKEFFRLKISTP